MSKNQSIAKLILDLIFPPKPYCLLCKRRLDKANSVICKDCINNIRPIVDPVCRKCGKPLKANSYYKSGLCYDCQTEYHPFTEARSFGNYVGHLKQIINEYKYHGKRELAEVLGYKMYICLRQLSWPTFDYLVPLPLHPKRLRERGFNQAELLARVIACQISIPIFKGLMRVKPTEHQTFLDKAHRKKNLKGAFKVATTGELNDKTVLLVDDVYTTGATAAEGSKTLLAAGAKAVYVLTCARG